MQLKDLLNEYKCRMSATNDYITGHVSANKPTVSRQTKGGAKVMKPTVIEKLFYLLGTDVESLSKNPSRFGRPLLGTTKAGYGLFAEENLAGYEEISRSDYYRGDYFLRVYGGSMTGIHTHDQDLIYVKQCDDVRSGTIAVTLVRNTEVTIKRIIKEEPFLILKAANPTVPARYFMQEGVRDLPVKIIGKALYSRSDIA